MTYPYISAQEAVKMIRSNDRVFVHGAAPDPMAGETFQIANSNGTCRVPNHTARCSDFIES